MFENTILNALKQYHIHIQTKNGLNNFSSSSLINHIKTCEKYIEQGNEVTTLWMKDNHIVVSKAVKHAYKSIQSDCLTGDDEYSSVEHRELNQCARIFTEFYEKSGIDSRYMDIDF